jgi:1,4-alpha-glucan branching enzyme
MFAQPGKKLLFMGGELAQVPEWNHDTSIEWHLLECPPHVGIQSWVRDLNRLYRSRAALHERDFRQDGFEWIDANDALNSVISFLRRGSSGELILVVSNFTPVPRYAYRVGVPQGGSWTELLNGDAQEYGGSGIGNLGSVVAERTPVHGRPWSLTLTLPPLATVFLGWQGKGRPK